MITFRRRHRTATLRALAIASGVAACSSGEDAPAPGEPDPVLVATVLDAAQLTAADNFAREIVGLRNGSTTPATHGRIGAFPDGATEGAALYAPVPGGRTTASFDIDSDGGADELDVFRRRDGASLLHWAAADRCRLAYAIDGAWWYFDVVCGGDGGLVCRPAADGIACQLCDAEYCSDCTVEGRAVECLEIVPPPEPEPEPDVPADEVGDDAEAGDDVAPDDADPADVEPSDIDTPDADFDLPFDLALDADVTIEDTPQSSGACDVQCMSAADAYCCTECGCNPSDCLPVCARPGYEWDCEVQCCFNYDLLQCDEG